MSDEEKTREEEVFNQKLEMDELDAASGGARLPNFDGKTVACGKYHRRPIYGYTGEEFPWCARSVTDGSLCDSNDACTAQITIYTGMQTNCERAWK